MRQQVQIRGEFRDVAGQIARGLTAKVAGLLRLRHRNCEHHQDQGPFHAHVERTVAAAGSDDQAAFIEADEEFHRALAEAAHNTFLASIVETITALKRRVLTVGLGTEPGAGMRRGAAEHQAIAAAVADGATEAAESAMHVHVDRALAGYRAEVQRNLFAAGTPTPSA
jgi:DNA-binding GntR family transcriptional regulator